MQLFIALVGHNASGKSHVAKRLENDLDISRVSADEFRIFVGKHIRYFNGLDISIQNEHLEQLTKLSLDYRFAMSWLLLDVGQHVIYDGSGATKAWRARYFNHVAQHYPNVLRVLIYVDISETELLERLHERGENWERQYLTSKKSLLEPPSPDEADLFLRYDQRNYAEILQALRGRMAALES